MKLTFALLAPLVAIASAVAIDGSVSLDKRTTARVQLCINTQYNSCNVFVVQVGACSKKNLISLIDVHQQPSGV